jgi:hypothetical protein
VAGVGTVPCSFVKGSISGVKMRLRVWQIAGINGYGAKRLGLGGGEFRIRAIYYGTNLATDAWLTLIHALQGTVVEIVDDFGGIYSSRLVQQIGPPQKRGNEPYGCRCEIELAGVMV